MTEPSSWKKFLALEPGLEETDFAAFSRYRARYKLARGLGSITIEGLSKSTADSYFAALRVTFAYTALEALETALRMGKGTQVLDEKLLTRLLDESNAGMCHALLESIDRKAHPRQHDQFQSLLNGKSNNLRYAAYAIRNLMAHGTLTANRIGLDRSKARRQLLNNLAECVLTTADQRFAKYVSSLSS